MDFSNDFHFHNYILILNKDSIPAILLYIF